MNNSVILLVLATDVGFGAAVTYTNVNGIALGLELAASTVSAGEPLRAHMIVSDYSSFGVVGISDGTRGPRDTAIGDFIVTDSFGAELPKTVPYTDWDPDVRLRPLIIETR